MTENWCDLIALTHQHLKSNLYSANQHLRLIINARISSTSPRTSIKNDSTVKTTNSSE